VQRGAEAQTEPQKTEALSVSKKKNNNKKGKVPRTASASTAITTPTQVRSPIQSPSPVQPPKRSILVVILEIAGVLAAIATIVGATGYALEKWQDTTATIDFSGDIDQKKPFTIPLIVKNPSSIFAIHMPRISCSVEAEYGGGDKTNFLAAAAQPPIGGMKIAPTETQNYFCNMPDKFTFTEDVSHGGAIIPIKQADMVVAFDYETWLPWPIRRRVTTRFVMLPTTSGFRWIKGKWIGAKQDAADLPAEIRHQQDPSPQ
jgi:hypothetical protein